MKLKRFRLISGTGFIKAGPDFARKTSLHGALMVSRDGKKTVEQSDALQPDKSKLSQD